MNSPTSSWSPYQRYWVRRLSVRPQISREYPKGVPLGQFDVYLEGLRKKDLE